MLFQNPPWQIISVSETGVKSYEGLAFDAINYLATKLNFTYTVITPEVSRSSKAWNTSRFAKLGEVRIYNARACFFLLRQAGLVRQSILFAEN